MHVERAAARQREERSAEHAAVVEREQEVRRERADPRDDVRGIGIVRRDRGDPAFGGRGGDRIEPACLARIVCMRDDQRHVDAVREQDLETAHADVVVGEDDGAGQGCCRRRRTRHAAIIREFRAAARAGRSWRGPSSTRMTQARSSAATNAGTSHRRERGNASASVMRRSPRCTSAATRAASATYSPASPAIHSACPRRVSRPTCGAKGRSRARPADPPRARPARPALRAPRESCSADARGPAGRYARRTRRRARVRTAACRSGRTRGCRGPRAGRRSPTRASRPSTSRYAITMT